MSAAQQKKDLENTLTHCGLDKKYFIYHMGSGKGYRFAISDDDSGSGVNPVTRFMSYLEMNAYLYALIAVSNNRFKFQS